LQCNIASRILGWFFFAKPVKKIVMRFLPAARIVILDADARHRDAVCRGLGELGLLQVLAAGTLPDARAMAQERAVDLIIVDGRGFEDLTREQGRKVLPNPLLGDGTPGILLSADTSRAMVHEAHNAGYRVVVALPVSPRLLYRRIGSILQRARRIHRQGSTSAFGAPER
jgi:DNA-binding response OmpR family regulator